MSTFGEKLAECLAKFGLKPKTNKLSYIFDCPKCQKEEKLWMFKESGYFRCWYCAEADGFRGKCEFALAPILGKSVKSIQQELYNSDLVTAEIFFEFQVTNHWSDEGDDEAPVAPPSKILWSPDYYPIDHNFSEKGVAYLAGRGIPVELASYYGVRYGPIDKRVAFPVEFKGDLFGWQARAIGPTEYLDREGKKRSLPKILSTESLSGKRDKIQFADQLIGTDQAIICEGAVDAIKCHLCRPAPDILAGNIATMGKAVSQAQINTLKYSGIKRVYLALDPDAEAEIPRLAKAFAPEVDVYLMKVPSQYKDFGEMDYNDVLASYKAAQKINSGQLFVHVKSFDEIMASRSRRLF